MDGEVGTESAHDTGRNRLGPWQGTCETAIDRLAISLSAPTEPVALSATSDSPVILVGCGRVKARDRHGQLRLVVPQLQRLYGSAETWPSGRRRSPAKGVGGKPSRGFESLRLRHPHFFSF